MTDHMCWETRASEPGTNLVVFAAHTWTGAKRLLTFSTMLEARSRVRRFVFVAVVALAPACDESERLAPPMPSEGSSYWYWRVLVRDNETVHRLGERLYLGDHLDRYYLDRRIGERKEEGTVAGVRDLLDVARTGVADRFGQLHRWTGTNLGDLDAIIAWDRENGDFLVWSESEGLVAIDEHRKLNRIPEDTKDGLLLRLEVDAEVWIAGTALPIQIRVRNVGTNAAEIDVSRNGLYLELDPIHRITGTDTVSHRSPKDVRTLAPGTEVIIEIELAGYFDTRDIEPGLNALSATLARSNSQRAGSLRKFLDVRVEPELAE